MALSKVEINGNRIVDKHTHYETRTYTIGPDQATVIIRGDIACDFQKKYGFPITSARKLQAQVEFGANRDRLAECQDVFKPGSHQIGAIDSIDDITCGMDVHILGFMEAINFEPVKRTYAIRIQDGSRKDRLKLKDSPLYRQIAEYIFDDVEQPDGKKLPISQSIADKLVRDFALQRSEVDALLVHCGLGRNRSPAVAIALNEIFFLGQDTQGLKSQYSEFNQLVYNEILAAGRRLRG